MISKAQSYNDGILSFLSCSFDKRTFLVSFEPTKYNKWKDTTDLYEVSMSNPRTRGVENMLCSQEGALKLSPSQ